MGVELCFAAGFFCICNVFMAHNAACKLGGGRRISVDFVIKITSFNLFIKISPNFQ